MLPPGQPGIWGHPQIPDRIRAVQSDSKKKRFKETIQFPLLGKNDKVGLIWID
jgi:hypothetical protein